MSAASMAQALRRHPLRQRRLWLPLAAVLLAVNLPFLHAALRAAPEVRAAVPFRDDFNRAALGDEWWSNGGHWRIVDGELYSPGAGNNPLWLKARLPAEARISFEVRSDAATGDVKWEAWGDGRNHATGYVFIFGGWNNRESRLARLDEHAATVEELRAQLALLARPYPSRVGGLEGLWEAARQPLVAWGARRDLARLDDGSYFGARTPLAVKRSEPKVVRGQRYKMVVTRKGGKLRWELDGAEMLELVDPRPLSGAGHDRFGFSSWQNDTWFDNLTIEPL